MQFLDGENELIAGRSKPCFEIGKRVDFSLTPEFLEAFLPNGTDLCSLNIILDAERTWLPLRLHGGY